MFAADTLKDKTAFISGGTSGINLGIAEALARHGARVCVIGRDPDKARRAAARIGAGQPASALAYSADVRDYDAVAEAMDQAVAELGALDIVVAGAAGNFFAAAADISPNGFKAVMDIDVLGTFHVFKAAHARCNAAGASFIAITAGHAVKPLPMQAHVCAAKAGVNQLLKTLALEWGAQGIRVNGISPGPIADTEGMRRFFEADPGLEARLRESIALGRLGSAEDIGNAAVFLASDLAGYVTGAIYNVDGGHELGDARPGRRA